MKKYIKGLLVALAIFLLPSIAYARTEAYEGYAIYDLVIRDFDGNRVGLLKKGSYVNGGVEPGPANEELLAFEKNGKPVTVYKKYLRSEKVMLQSRANVRSSTSAKGSLVTVMEKGTYLDVDRIYSWGNGYWYKALYKNREVYIYDSNVAKKTTWVKGYLSSNTNVRNLSGRVLRVDKKGTIVSGFRLDNWIYPRGKDEGTKIYAPLVVKNKPRMEEPIRGFTRGNVNIRNAKNYNNSSKVRQTKGSVYINGTLTEDGKWVRFKNYGDTAYVSKSVFNKLDKGLKGKWIKEGDNTFYIDSTRTMVRGWRKIGGSYYYFDPEYRYMYKGVKNTGYRIHYFTPSGKMSTGKKTIKGTSKSQTITFYGPTRYDLSNKYLNQNPKRFLKQAAVNSSLGAIGTKYYWYGVDLKNGVYCSGLLYAAYKDVGVTIPGPEYGNEARARQMGPRSGPAKRGWGPAGDYGLQMVIAQYTKTQNYYGGQRYYWNNDGSKLQTGDLLFARDPGMKHLKATHALIYAGMINGKAYVMHSGFRGTYLDHISVVPQIWRFPYRPYAQRVLDY